MRYLQGTKRNLFLHLKFKSQFFAEHLYYYNQEQKWGYV